MVYKNIFDIPDGVRVELSKVELDNGDTVSFSAITTNQYRVFNGEDRRLFIDASIVFWDGGRDIWLGNGGDMNIVSSLFERVVMEAEVE